jgi:Spy/CpxP family protein refolding chaperone
MGGGTNAVALAMTELTTALSKTNTPADEIQEKVAAVRNARQKAKADLTEAEKNLRQLLTPGQQTVLVSLGYLE